MKFINKTKNSVQLEDVNISIPYINESPQEIDTQSVKKSFAFQQMVAMGGFKVLAASNDRIEQNLLRISKNHKFIDESGVQRLPSGNKTEVIIRGHFYESTGYSKVNRNLALSLYKQNISVEIDPISFKNNDMNEIEAKVFSTFRKPVGKDAILVDSVIPTQANPISGNYNILYTTSESCHIPKQFIDAASMYDELWVTSSFSKNAFHFEGYKKPITIVPPIVNRGSYNERVIPYSFRPQLKSFSFLSVLTWGYRKGSDALLKAYCKAFNSSDDVSLVLLIAEKSKTAQEEIKKDIRKSLDFAGSPHVCVCMKTIPEYQLPSFYKACNAFVLPSRGEGFGLPFCEASLCGLPVISTRYGGQLDFLSDENSTLVTIDDLEKPKEGTTGVHYWDEQPFPSLKSDRFISDLAFSMRYVYNNYDSVLIKNKLLQNKIVESFSGEIVGHQTKNILTPIWNSMKEQRHDSSSRHIKQNSYSL